MNEKDEIKKLADELDELLQLREKQLIRINSLLREIQEMKLRKGLSDFSDHYS